MKAIAEKDWKVFGRLRTTAHERFYKQALDGCRAIVDKANQTSVEGFGALSDFVGEQDKIAEQIFGDYRRSTAMHRLYAFMDLDLLRDEELSEFSDEARERIALWMDADGSR